ncbi:MAG TPA: rhomboid family intramembrane serine protease [Stellaceae bacterium]|nr:rhomboid family intramembrane serine protease [Stellaceae bacterium]
MLALPLYDDTPRIGVPIVTYGLIAACTAVFLWQEGLGPRAADAVAYVYGMTPAVLFGHAELPARLRVVPPWATIFTSMFIHGGWIHLLGNMLYLWLFGKATETALGPVRFAVFYLVCGTIAALTQALVAPASTVPMIGASGAIAGVLGAYLILHPRGNVVVLIWIIIIVRLITVPAVILLGLWFLLQLMSALSAPAGEPGVAVWAHVGGFIAGMVLVPFVRRRGVRLLQPRRTASFSRAPRRRRGPWG